MMFLPGSTTNANLQEIKPIAEQALRGFNIVLVSGAEDMSNATAERDVKEAIERAEKNNQHVLILSAGMAQRSFSIPQITELY
jgi:dihydroxyacetone kinase DhaKLM complex PTS-EIIA-like component DhaM